MFNNLLLTVVSDDKPGIVEEIAKAVAEHEGNWLESRLAQLGGKFAGVVHVAVPQDQESAVREALNALKSKSIWINIEEYTASSDASSSQALASFSAVGPDRPGIVREITQAFTSHQINVAEIETSLSSMPYSGEPLFEAEGVLQLPAELDMQDLQDTLNTIADSLGMDISLTKND
ncbi:hypothetical protein TDB9533_02388 [Thalassocella blandensis]|nr:hypothetical protein TDB9533_02388 [Thalassocella blandensis]